MTAAFKKGFLWASPESIAQGIERAILKRKDVVIYRLVEFYYADHKHIPENIFKRLPL